MLSMADGFVLLASRRRKVDLPRFQPETRSWESEGGKSVPGKTGVVLGGHANVLLSLGAYLP